MFSLLLALLFSATPAPASAKAASVAGNGPVMNQGRLPGQTPHCARRHLAAGSPLREVDSQARRGEIPPSAFGIPVSPWRRTSGVQWSDSPAALQGRFDGAGHSLRIQFCVWVI